MRGLPGSGKSTKAKELVGEGVIHSTDSFFEDPSTGEYKFDPSKIGEYHQKNLEAAVDSMRKGITPVIIDNTNIKRWEFKKYTDAADHFGYEVKFVILDPTNYTENEIQELVERQKRTHNVPKEAIIRMLKNWED